MFLRDWNLFVPAGSSGVGALRALGRSSLWGLGTFLDDPGPEEKCSPWGTFDFWDRMSLP